MTNRSGVQSQAIDSATLTPLVRQALASDTAEVTEWRAQQVHGGYSHGSAGGSSIHRVTGQARDEGGTVKMGSRISRRTVVYNGD